jgi:hypothetical protein
MGNSEVNSSGDLIMGAGIAKQAKKNIPGIEFTLGSMVRKMNNPFYGCIVLDNFQNHEGVRQVVGVLQTKYTWRAKSNILLVRRSLADLFFYMTSNPTMSVDMVMPGVGLGGLDESEILPIMQLFPDTVTVWKE